MSFYTSYVYFGEVFPNEYRALASGTCVSLGRLAGVTFPVVTNFLINHDIYP